MSPTVRATSALLALCACSGSLVDESDTDTDLARESMRNRRYCEVIAVTLDNGTPTVSVYNTGAFSECPQAAWDALDTAAIQQQLGAVRIILNGPRHWVLDELAADLDPNAEVATFGELQMILAATIEVDPTQVSDEAYVERVIARDTEWVFFEGTEVWELASPQGDVYAMQSYSLQIDGTQTLETLGGLGTVLTLPPDWTFRVVHLDEDRSMFSSNGEAVVLQDDLANTYQRVD